MHDSEFENTACSPTGKPPTGIILHALHKSASMFMYQLMFRLAREKGVRHFSANHIAPDDEQLPLDINQDFCLGPVRVFKRIPGPFSSALRIRRIFQLRDPRDILVSQYFSFGWSHTDKDFDPREVESRDRIRNMTIDEYCLDASGAVRQLENHLKPLVAHPPTPDDIVVHYEQMVTRFRGWLKQFIKPFGFPRLGLQSERLLIAKYAFKYRREFLPSSEPDSHKRSVLPGDHRRRLKPGTIKQMNARLEPLLTALGYQVEFNNDKLAAG